jgi:hypothetical protein
VKNNEICYIQIKNKQFFEIYKESDLVGKSVDFKNFMRIRVLSNLPFKISKNNLSPKNEDKKFTYNSEFNFFGLLLRVSKDFLTPTYNLIIHTHGGGVISQSSKSHLSYLSQYIYINLVGLIK